MNPYDFATDLVKRAGVQLKSFHNEALVVSHKGTDPRDVLTSADTELNKFLVSEITRAFPEHRIYSEEGDSSDNTASAEWEWTLDPIDGSANFARSIPHFAVCVGLLHNNVPVLGAVYNPITDELFSFEKGKGAFLNGMRIHASTITEPKEAYSLLRTGRKEEYLEWGVITQRDFLTNMKKVSNFGSSALDLCFIGAKRAEVVAYGTLTTQDIAVAVGLVREAGGEVYTIDGEPVTLSKKSQLVVATATRELFDKIQPLLHKELLPR